ncbi:MAG TPA: hypothetical protein VGN27_06605 [Gaiellaceae bacterium]|nr:hypothetical protein [Gaiellaceae bacterium]
MSPATMIVVFSLAAGVAVVGYAWYRTGGKKTALSGTVPGGSKWDFSKSWGSNLTLLGAILSTTLSSSVFPKKATVVLARPGDYIALSLVFLTLVTVAPFVNNALLIRKDLTGEKDVGRASAVFTACCLTLWGVIGQLGTLGLAFYEVKRAGAIAPGAVVFAWIVIGAALLLIVPYSTETIAVIVRSEPKRSARRKALQEAYLLEVGSTPAPARPAGWAVL